jgi:hypothetical protein
MRNDTVVRPGNRQRNLVVLGCSATKIETKSPLPAVHLYDGPSFRVLRSFLREYYWPDVLSVAVLSAKYGLIGGLYQIESYEQRMTARRAADLNKSVTSTLCRLTADHSRFDLVMGKDYLPSIDVDSIVGQKVMVEIAAGGIGEKLHHLHALLRELPKERKAPQPTLARRQRPLYFLPDWDDFVDSDFDFKTDKFSAALRADRSEKHISSLTKPAQMCDGVLVSLAQHLGSKGILKHFDSTDAKSLAPRSVRKHFSLNTMQWAFGDCGAFSYSSENDPAISVEQAVHLYELYDFDLGASVDHIPLREVIADGKSIPLTMAERRRRIDLTRDNADRFMNLCRSVGARFIPVGVIQGIKPADYGRQVGEYIEMGYTHLALGGLVPRSDDEISAIVSAVSSELAAFASRPWLHLLGVFRPRLQDTFRNYGVNSFDSATYFRKSWLRSDQNYLGSDGIWYAAIRVPPTTDARTLIRLKQSGLTEQDIQALERDALSALHLFDAGKLSLTQCLNRVHSYDKLLSRSSDDDGLLESYKKTLTMKPWRKCKCAICQKIGIDVLIFRGLNRNKRRGAHNTLQLFRKLNA